MKLIQTDASINNGNSGGPLINAYGQVVGITSVKVSSTYGEGLGFAIPIDEALPIVEDLMKYGYVTGRPTMGISGKDITEIYSQYYRVPEGFLVTDITREGPAEQAGIEIGDIIVGINGETVKTRSEINAAVEKFKAGDTITVAYYRQDKIESVDLVLGDAAETGKGADTKSDNNDYDDYDPYEEFRKFYGGFGF
jgi:serine protease Do